jgi:hypothetical protein
MSLDRGPHNFHLSPLALETVSQCHPEVKPKDLVLCNL